MADLDNREGAAREKLEVYFNMAAKPVSEKDNDGAVAAPNGEHADDSHPDKQLAESPETGNNPTAMRKNCRQKLKEFQLRIRDRSGCYDQGRCLNGKKKKRIFKEFKIWDSTKVLSHIFMYICLKRK